MPLDVKLVGSVGRITIDDNAAYGTPDYYNWSMGGKYNLQGFDLLLEYVDTDVGEDSCAGLCGARAVFTVSHSF